jgi:hypothetical protein
MLQATDRERMEKNRENEENGILQEGEILCSLVR